MIINQNNKEKINKQDLLKIKKTTKNSFEAKKNNDVKNPESEIEKLFTEIESTSKSFKNSFQQDPLAKLPTADLKIIKTLLEKSDKINLLFYLLLFIFLILILLIIFNLFIWFNLQSLKPEKQPDLQPELEDLQFKYQQIKQRQDILEDRLKPILDQLPNGSNRLNQDFSLPDYNTEAWLGNQDSSLVWIVYSSPNCSACADLHTLMLDIKTEFETEISLVHRHYPKNAEDLEYIYALECLNKDLDKGDFWQVLTKFYQNNVSAEELWTLSTKINQENFLKCYNSRQIRQEINTRVANQRNSLENIIFGTPTSIFYSQADSQTKIVAGLLNKSDFKIKIQEML